MGLSTIDLSRIVGQGAPVLLLDTCVLLDIIRDITRPEVQLPNISAAMEILKAAETGTDLVMLIAEQVSLELNDNIQKVEDEAEKGLVKFLEQAKRIDEVAGEFGATGALSTLHLKPHVPRARAVMNRWINMAVKVSPGHQVATNAMARVVKPRAPSRRGKESAKDCLVVEAYLEIAAQLRAAQYKGKIVFASSNTADYIDPNIKKLHHELELDFSPSKVEYAPNFGAAKFLLGI